MDSLKVGVVGVGHLGQHHARIYAELMNTELVGVVDSSLDRVEEIAGRFDAPAYDDLDRFLDRQRPDAVSVVVPTVSHFAVARRLLERGINVLVEKPVTTTVEQAESLLQLAHKKHAVLQVGHIERFNGAVRYLTSELSDPLFIRSIRQGPFASRIADVGVVLDLMIHDIDIILSLVKSDVRSIVASGRSVCSDHEDLAVAHIVFENGTIADIASSRVSPHRTRTMEVTTTDRSYVVDFESQDISVIRAGHAVQGATSVEVTERPLFPRMEPLKLELEHFLSCVREGKEPLVGISDGKRALAVAIEILKQIQFRQ